MPKKHRKFRRKTSIPKDWKPKDGIIKLPVAVRAKVSEVLLKLHIGEEQQEYFLAQGFSPSQRQVLAFELSRCGVSYQDIAMLLGVSVQGAFQILDRARVEFAMGLPPQWLAANLIDDYYTLKNDSQWGRARAESEDDPIAAARFRQIAVVASSKAGEILLKAEEVAKQLREQQQAASGQDQGEPHPSDRVNLFQWVFENKIMATLEPPAPAEQVESKSEPPAEVEPEKPEPIVVVPEPEPEDILESIDALR